ncbi:hypothetical protein [Marinomonas sp.]|uniref:hypothetical protein n=1 Tax=Marinomonas sp. TaxID=1904862 RepID=UPI003A925382
MQFDYTLKNGSPRTITFTSKVLDAFCKGHDQQWVREQTSFMAIGFGLMMKYPNGSHEWIAANALFAGAFNHIFETAGYAVAVEINKRMQAFCGRHAVAATAR